MMVAARYEGGVFKPLQEIAIEEGTVVEVHVPAAPSSKPHSIRELGFVGMWADRDDITDGVSYVDKLRDNPRR
jgi:hypothetical protein